MTDADKRKLFEDSLKYPPKELIEEIRRSIAELEKAMPPATSPEVLHTRMTE